MIWKKLIVIGFLLLTAQPTFAMESIISSLIINDEDEQEIEIVMDKDKMYLPCKYMFDYLEIPYKENHAEKSLVLKNAVISSKSVHIGGVKQNYNVFFVKAGMTGLKNEFFIPADALSKITEKNITSDSSQLLAFIRTKEFSEEKKDENPFMVRTGGQKVKAFDEIVLPVQKSWITLDNIGFRENAVSDSYSQIYKDTQTKNCSLNNNMQVSFAGKLNSGQYKVDMGTNTFSNNLFAFSGISPQYKSNGQRKLKNLDYLIGKADAWDFAGTSISQDIMGLQLKDHVENKDDNYRAIEGYVNPTSTVKVYINNDFEKELSTYGGYYSLKDVGYGKDIYKIKIDELLADGTTKEAFSKIYKSGENKKKIPRRDFILGLNGLQNKLWANNSYIYQDTTKKGVLGFKYHKDISSKLSFDDFIIADKILSGSADSSWGESIIGDKKYLNFTTMRNPNALEGETYMGALTYKNNEKMDSKFFFGVSDSVSNDGITPQGPGYFAKYESNYYVDQKTTIKESIFAGSPNFYTAGASSGGSGFMADKIGASIGGDSHFKNISFSGTYSRYKSNFGDYYEGGLIDFDEYNLVARTNFKKFPTISLKINNKRGKNDIGEINSSSYELSMNKKFKSFGFNGGIRKNSYANLYNAEGYSSYSSDYSDIFTEIGFPLGKRFGYLTLGHDIVETLSDTSVNNYKSINVGYTTPSFKGVNCNISTGFHYAGTNKGNDMGFGVTKRLKSGSTVSLNYRYSQTPYYIVDNMYLPSSMRHSITVDFSELYGIGGKGLQPIGTGNENKGYLQVSAFLDVNQNGIRDKGEPTIENIPIKIENDSEVLLTTKNGTTKLKAEDAGIHNVQVFEEQLPTFLSCHNKTKPSRYIKIENNSKTKVDFGLISSVGNINGSITVKDEYNNSLRIQDLVVSVMDVNGKEVNYTNLNEDGTFSISGLNPGKYFVGIDKELQEAYKIAPEADSENYTVEIPPVYKDYVNIDNVNLNYKYLL